MEAYHRTEESKPRGFRGSQWPARLEGCNLVGKGQSRLEQEPCLYPTRTKLAYESKSNLDQRTLHLRGRPLTL